MISRREILLASLAAVMLPSGVIARADKSSFNADSFVDDESIDWAEFQQRMLELAETAVGSSDNKQAVSASGVQCLKRLNIHSTEFKAAQDEAYETGNRFWLWQRMIKQKNINGGILNIGSDQMVQLHDHPGATGLLRIVSGETEVWQFDERKVDVRTSDENNEAPQVTELVRVSRRILKAGDTAVLTPEKGNIHALKAVSEQCSMLDFFIPPYERSQRSWYEPLEENWFDKEMLSCRKIPQHAYTRA